jgi:hypothetical protein
MIFVPSQILLEYLNRTAKCGMTCGTREREEK